MLDVFRGLKTLIKKSSVTIDSSIFRLHYSISGTDFVFLQFFDQSSQIFPHMREIAKYSAVAYFLDSLIAHDKNFSKRHFIISKAILCTTEASSIKHQLMDEMYNITHLTPIYCSLNWGTWSRK